MVNIYYLKLNNFTLSIDDLKSILSDCRQQKLSCQTCDEVRKESLAAEAVLQYAFREFGFNIPLNYCYGPKGKPQVDDCYFSLSHTEGAVIVAVSNSVVGIDLEKKRTIDPKVAKKILTEDELAYFESVNNQEYLIDTFVRKESYFKYLGEGIGENMKLVSASDILNNSKQVALCFDDYLSIITTKQKDLYDVTKVTVEDILDLVKEVRE